MACRVMRFRRSQPVLMRRKYLQGRVIRGVDVKDIYWLDPSGKEMQDEQWNTASARSLGVLIVGDALDEVDEQGRPLRGDTLLFLLNAQPLLLPTGGRDRSTERRKPHAQAIHKHVKPRSPPGRQWTTGRTRSMLVETRLLFDGPGRQSGSGSAAATEQPRPGMLTAPGTDVRILTA